MHSIIKWRLTIFLTAIGLMVSLIFWTAHNSWNQFRELREKLTSVQLESFRIADYFQRSVLQLNNVILHYQTHHAPEDLKQFETLGTALDHWIDERRPTLSSARERAVLDQIDRAYDDYREAARQIAQPVRGEVLADGQSRGARFERESERLLDLGYQLAESHRESMNYFLTRSNRSLSQMQIVLLTALFLLLLLGAGLAFSVYKEMIAPLRTKLVEAEALVERSEKLASLGVLAAGVAHEIRNPLTAIKARLFTLQKVVRNDSPEQTDIGVISSEINRLEKIVKDFLLFARPTEPDFQRVAADEPLRDVAALLQAPLETANIRLLLPADSAQAFILIDRNQIKQVLINLVQNAADSIGRDGTIILGLKLDNKRVQQGPTDVVILEVQDSGKGIPAEVQKRLFDPFFSTKDAGTGLGLSIAALIVQKHGGALRYQTSIGRGTTFGIVLPRARP